MLTEFGRDFVAALASTPHSISPKYFYDVEGSRLFDRICALPEYYPTRTELAILQAHAAEMAALAGPAAETSNAVKGLRVFPRTSTSPR